MLQLDECIQSKLGKTNIKYTSTLRNDLKEQMVWNIVLCFRSTKTCNHNVLNPILTKPSYLQSGLRHFLFYRISAVSCKKQNSMDRCTEIWQSDYNFIILQKENGRFQGFCLSSEDNVLPDEFGGHSGKGALELATCSFNKLSSPRSGDFGCDLNARSKSFALLESITNLFSFCSYKQEKKERKKKV